VCYAIGRHIEGHSNVWRESWRTKMLGLVSNGMMVAVAALILTSRLGRVLLLPVIWRSGCYCRLCYWRSQLLAGVGVDYLAPSWAHDHVNPGQWHEAC